MAKTAQERKTPAEYLKAPYGRMLFLNDDGSYTAEMLEFTGCFAEGRTAEEAVRNLDQSALEWIESSLNLGREIPEPFATRGYSGTISLRIPKAIHRQAVRMAEREGVSLNQYLLSAISARVGADDLFNRLGQKLATMTTTINVATISMNSVAVNTTVNLSGNIGSTVFQSTTLGPGNMIGTGTSPGQWWVSGGIGAFAPPGAIGSVGAGVLTGAVRIGER